MFVEAIMMESDSNPPSQSSEMDIDDLDVINAALPPQKKQKKAHNVRQNSCFSQWYSYNIVKHLQTSSVTNVIQQLQEYREPLTAI